MYYSEPSILNIQDQQDWRNLQDKVQEVKDQLESLENRATGKSEEKPSIFINESLIVETLRSPERPEVVYWLLRSYAEANSDAPIIYTDKGKAIYIDYDRLEDNVTAYIGNTGDIVCISENKGCKIHLMDVIEKVDFLLYSSLGVVLKRQLSAQAILDLARHANLNCREEDMGLSAPLSPTLVFSTGTESECALRTDWVLSTHNFAESKAVEVDSFESKNNVLFAFRNFEKRHAS